MRKLNGCRRVAQPQIEYKTERAVRDFSRNSHGSHFAVDGTALNGPAISALADVEKPRKS